MRKEVITSDNHFQKAVICSLGNVRHCVPTFLILQVINQAVDDHTRDNMLFAINSKRASPVEVASEAMEETGAANYASSTDLSRGGEASAAAAAPAVAPEPQTRDGVVSAD